MTVFGWNIDAFNFCISFFPLDIFLMWQKALIGTIISDKVRNILAVKVSRFDVFRKRSTIWVKFGAKKHKLTQNSVYRAYQSNLYPSLLSGHSPNIFNILKFGRNVDFQSNMAILVKVEVDAKYRSEFGMVATFTRS